MKRTRIRAGRDRSDYSGKRGTVGSSGKRDEDLFFFMGLLWLSDFLLRRRHVEEMRYKCGKYACKARWRFCAS